MDTQAAIIKKLEIALSAITQALAAIRPRDQAVGEEASIYLSTCKFCGKPITQRDKTNRGIHKACYSLAHDRVSRQETTWEQLVKDGKVDPKKPGGRPRKPTPIDADNPSNYVQSDQTQPAKKKGKRKP